MLVKWIYYYFYFKCGIFSDDIGLYLVKEGMFYVYMEVIGLFMGDEGVMEIFLVNLNLSKYLIFNLMCY